MGLLSATKTRIRGHCGWTDSIFHHQAIRWLRGDASFSKLLAENLGDG